LFPACGKSDDDTRAAVGDSFPKHINHSIVCIVIAHQEDGRWVVDALGAPHVGERSEPILISSFDDRVQAVHAARPTAAIRHRSHSILIGTYSSVAK
jgi:hypothetical protein